jgi:xanthine dehydrogenase YagS FAD-binding subunit
MKPFRHLNAQTVDQAVEALVKHAGKARLNAGGTDLFGLLKDEYLAEYPEAIVNIKTIAGLDYIREDKTGLRIGALAKLSDLAGNPLIRERYGVLAEAARAVASPQIRNVATIGGNLCQDVRCSYYRYPKHIGGPIQCARKGSGPCLAVRGDNRYHALLEGRKCFAVCPSDIAVALSALDAQLLVAGPAGERRLAASEFYTALGNRLDSDEMVREIEVPAVSGPARQVFSKFTLRRPIDFAIVSVAAVITVANGICSEARIALGAVAPGAHRAVAAEEYLKGRAIDQETAARTGELALQDAKPLSRNAYKVEIAKTLVARAVLGLPPDNKQNDLLVGSDTFDPTELSTFHRCGSSASPSPAGGH